MTAALATLVVVTAAAPAHAASSPAAAVITGCKDDHMTIVGAVKLTGRPASRARGAALQLRFTALPLFGLPRPAAWRDLGKKLKGSGQESFTGLGADSWGGVMSWRFRKGSKSVLSGDERTQPGKVGAVKGTGFCTLFEGVKPADRTPPVVTFSPEDQVWHHGPAQVSVSATDDFSGVRSVVYSVDGGPATAVRNGGTFPIATEGAHNVVVAATDVAGNTGYHAAVVRVDTAPPTQAQMTRPFSVTASTTPTFEWTASTDSGSGLRGYFLAIRHASDGQLISLTPVDPSATSAPSPEALTDGESYTASVVALDNTDTPFSSESDPLGFRVDTHLDVTDIKPPDGTVLSFGARDGNMVISLDRPADPATVTAATVALHRNAAAGGDPGYSLTCSSPCSTITLDPQGTLPEGRYTLTVSGVKSEEGQAFPLTSEKLAVDFYENDFDSTGCSGNPSAQFAGSGWSCNPHGALPGKSFGTDSPTRNCSAVGTPPDTTLTATSAAIPFSTTAANEQASVSFDWVFSTDNGGDSATATVMLDGSTAATWGAPGQSGSAQQNVMTFTVPAAGSHQLTIQQQLVLKGRTSSGCGAASTPAAGLGYAFDNVVATRRP